MARAIDNVCTDNTLPYVKEPPAPARPNSTSSARRTKKGQSHFDKHPPRAWCYSTHHRISLFRANKHVLWHKLEAAFSFIQPSAKSAAETPGKAKAELKLSAARSLQQGAAKTANHPLPGNVHQHHHSRIIHLPPTRPPRSSVRPPLLLPTT